MATTTRVEESEPARPFTEQEPFLYDSHRYYGYVSGVGAGKTAVGVMRSALNVERWNPGRMGAVVAPTTQMIKNAILPLMREFGLMDRWTYKGPQAEAPGIHTPNGSRIVILSADNKRQIERLASLNLGWWWIDEERDVDPRARQILIQRLRDGDYTNGFITTTPRGQNHTYDFFIGDHDPEEYTHGKATIYETEDRLAITGVPPEANPHLDPTDIQAIRDAHPQGLLQQEVEGNFVEVGSGILTKDMLTFEHVENLSDRPLTYTIGVDLGVEADAQKARENDTDYWAASLIAIDKQVSQAYLIDIHRQRGMSLQQGVEWLSSVVSDVPNPSIYVESNQAQRWFLQECRSNGLSVTPVDHTQNKEERLIQASIPFENGSIKLLNRDVDTQLGYDPRFKEFVNEWLAFPTGRHDDAIDSVATALENIQFARSTILGADPYGDEDEDEYETWNGMWRKKR